MTRIRTLDKRPMYIPNNMFSKVVVITPSRMSHRRFKETIGIRYEDFRVVKDIMRDIKKMVDEHHGIDHTKEALVHLHSFGSYAIEVLVEVLLTRVDTEGYAEMREDLLFKIAEIVEQHRAEIAYPTSVVHLSPQVLNKLLSNQ